MGSLLNLVSWICLLSVSALGVGDQAPALTGTTWVKGKAPVFEKQYTVIEFWSSRCEACRPGVPYLTRLQRFYGEELAVVGLSDEPLEDIRSHVAGMDEEPGYSLGRVLPEVRGKYMGDTRSVPYAFLVNQQGIVVWEGYPMDLEDVLGKAFSGLLGVGFSRRLVALEKALKKSFETRDLDRIAGAAEAILALDATHERAIDVRAEVAKRQKDPTAFRKVYDRIGVKGLGAEKAARLAWGLVTQRDFSYRNMDVALALARHAVREEPGNSAAAVTYARVQYCLGNIEEAIAWQRKGTELDPEDEGSRAVLEYYRRIKVLRELGTVSPE